MLNKAWAHLAIIVYLVKFVLQLGEKSTENFTNYDCFFREEYVFRELSIKSSQIIMYEKICNILTFIMIEMLQ